MSWYSIRGPIVRANGTSGTVTLPEGAHVLQIIAHASGAGSISMFGDAAVIPLPASSGWWALQEHHAATVAPAANRTIVFTGTDSYMVEYSTEGG